jgi:hypothetical protein
MARHAHVPPGASVGEPLPQFLAGPGLAHHNRAVLFQGA